ncbi:enoyl-CoA hydratase/isomerase family protein [Microbacterium profundi]|uniref:Enoyl-CoA hydratase/isomerase family protein n=1 Tax=Microbacterium profundi TaxID=450380 RepID=A0ABV3LD74_9MICO
MTNDIIITDDDSVAIVTINRAPTNYFDLSLISQIANAYEAAAAGGARAVVLRSDGKHFCAGADFSGGEMATDRNATTERLYREAIKLFRARLPIVAAVQGSAVGGGLGLACSADFRVASSATRFHANFSMLGFHQGFGISETLPAIVGHQAAMDLLYTSRRVDGEQAFTLGLADRLAEAGRETEVALEYAHEIANAAPLAVQSMKLTLRGGLADRVAVVVERELAEQKILWDTADSQEGIRANIAREVPSFIGK